MILFTRNLVRLLGVALALLVCAHQAAAQSVIYSPYVQTQPVYYYPYPAVSYYAPPAVNYYYAAPAVSYYVQPTVTYVAPRVAYYPTPVTSYYVAPVNSYYYHPGYVSTAGYGHFGHPRVATYYYPR